MDREWVEEAREDERAAAAGRLRARSLADAVTEAMAAGDRLTVRCGTRSWSGTVIGIGGDHAVVVARSGRIAVHLGGPVVLRRVASSEGGTAGDRSHGSFRARLATAELAGDRVEVVTATESVIGRLAVVAVDHVVIDGGDAETWVPIREIGVVTLD